MEEFTWDLYWKQIKWDDFWLEMHTIMDWQGCALSLGLNPHAISRKTQSHINQREGFIPAIEMNATLRDEFTNRLLLIRNNMHPAGFFHKTANVDENEIKFKEFVIWALSANKVTPLAIDYFNQIKNKSARHFVKDSKQPKSETTKSTSLSSRHILKKPSRIFGYNLPLYDSVKSIFELKGDIPQGYEIIAAWKVKKPDEIFEVMDKSFKYLKADGDVKEVDLSSLNKAIGRLFES